jgi:hypothetical protein
MTLRDFIFYLSSKAIYHFTQLKHDACLGQDRFRRRSTAYLLRLATEAFATIAATTRRDPKHVCAALESVGKNVA